MRTFRLVVLAVLFAVGLVGCVTFADSYSDQNPRNVTASQAATATLAPTPQPLPNLSAPTLSVSQTGAQEATFSWDAVPNADGYQLQWRNDDTTWGPIGVDVTQSETSVSYELPIEETYDYRVRAVADNSDGTGYISGPWSTVVSFTLAGPTPTPTPVPTSTPTP